MAFETLDSQDFPASASAPAPARIFDDDNEHHFIEHEQDFETMSSKSATSKARHWEAFRGVHRWEVVDWIGPKWRSHKIHVPHGGAMRQVDMAMRQVQHLN